MTQDELGIERCGLVLDFMIRLSRKVKSLCSDGDELGIEGCGLVLDFMIRLSRKVKSLCSEGRNSTNMVIGPRQLTPLRLEEHSKCELELSLDG